MYAEQMSVSTKKLTGRSLDGSFSVVADSIPDRRRVPRHRQPSLRTLDGALHQEADVVHLPLWVEPRHSPPGRPIIPFPRQVQSFCRGRRHDAQWQELPWVTSYTAQEHFQNRTLCLVASSSPSRWLRRPCMSCFSLSPSGRISLMAWATSHNVGLFA